MTFKRPNLAALVPLFLTLSAAVGCDSSVDEQNDELSAPELLADHDTGTGVRPDPADVKATARGSSSCGNFAFSPSADYSDFTAIFGEVRRNPLKIFSGPRAIDCSLTIHYEFPAGWTFDAPRTVVAGFVQTDETSRTTLTVKSGIGRGTSTASRAFGPSTYEDFQLVIDDQTAARRGGSVRCGATSADIQVQLTATPAGRGTAYTAIDAVHGLINWRRCK
jgi:hypothetical protein